MIQNFISKLSEQEKKILYVAIAFVLLAFLDRLFLGPAFSKLDSLDEEIEQQKNVISRDLRFLTYKDKILKEKEDFSVYYTPSIKTEEEIIADFLKNIESLATQAGVNLIKVSPSDSKQKRGYMEYYANLECDGTLENVATFMHLVDSSETLLKIVRVSINPKRASAEEVTAIMTIEKLIINLDAETIEEESEFGTPALPQTKGMNAQGQQQGEQTKSTIEGEANSGVSSTLSVGGKTGEPSGKPALKPEQKELSSEGQAVSERFRPNMKDKPAQKPAEQEKPHEIKPSIFERILNQTKTE